MPPPNRVQWPQDHPTIEPRVSPKVAAGVSRAFGEQAVRAIDEDPVLWSAERLQQGDDGPFLRGWEKVGGLALEIRNEEGAYQRLSVDPTSGQIELVSSYPDVRDGQLTEVLRRNPDGTMSRITPLQI